MGAIGKLPLIGTSGFFREYPGNLLTEIRTFVFGGFPYNVPINSKIRMNKDVAKTHDLGPRYMGVSVCQFVRQACCGFAYN